MNNISRFDPTRQTAGAIYRNAQLHGERGMVIGDMNYELRKGLVEDLNDTIEAGTKQFEGKIFYITVYEKKDLQMKNAFVRKMIKTRYRPYPEANTLVFKSIPASQCVYFCWSLPERHEMINMLNSAELRTKPHEMEELQLFRHWDNDRLEYFGFKKNSDGHWGANHHYKGDQLIASPTAGEVKVSLHQSKVACL